MNTRAFIAGCVLLCFAPSVKYAPVPWVHLAESLRPSHRRLRVVLEEPAFADRTFVRLYDGPRAEQVTDVRPLLDSNAPMSARERAALEILQEAGPSHAKKGRFALIRAQVGRLLSFATDVALEVEGKGGIVLNGRAARLTGRVRPLEDGHLSLVFEATDADGLPLKGPLVLGEREAFLLDDELRLHRIAPPLLPREAMTIMMSEPLLVDGLATEEGAAGFEAVVGLGVDLADLVEIAERSDPPPRITLRALLANDDATRDIALRVHLVTELSHGGKSEEVEVPARGALPPIVAIPGPKDDDGVTLLSRPTTIEEEARRALFDLGLSAAGSHRGFQATGEAALDMLIKIAQKEGIPPTVIVDEDTLPRIVRLPDIPLLSAARVKGDKRGLLSVTLDIGAEARELAVSFDAIVKASMAGRRSLLVDEDTVIGFTPEAGKGLELLSEALEISSLDAERMMGQGELALLIAALGGRVELNCPDDVRANIEAFLAEPTDADREVPKTVLADLRPYQRDGLAWLMRLHRLKLGRILADDMGLGKTLMAMSLIARAKEEEGSKPTLVVAPTSVLDVWVDEAKRHAPSLKVLKWHGRDRSGLEEVASDTDIVVTSYALLRRDVDSALGAVDFRYLMLDEAQHVKNPGTEAWKAARQVSCDQRVALTGTPIENRVEELWSILELVAPGLLGTAKMFDKRYARPIAKGDPVRLDELKRRTRPVILRRKKDDVAKDLPPKIETILRCDMDDKQRGLYLRVLAEVRSDVEKALKLETKSRARAPILAALMRLRQVCCDPRLVLGEDGAAVGSAKLDLFEEVMTEALESDRRIIVFSQFVEMQKLLHGVLNRIGAGDALWLHGATRNRGEVVAAFQKPDGPRVIVVSLKAGGTGVTLTNADTVVHYDPWWNPAVEDQATDRAHRIGQTKTVHVLKLACADSIEERMLALGDDKRAAAEGVLGRDGPGPRSLSLEEIQSILDEEASRGF
jgi:superfamily II DNA or RNA helicase